MVEISTVIINAGLTPTHDDLTQLWQALMILFAQKYITTPIIKTVHGTGADFPDLISAFRWRGHYILTPTGFVTFMIARGKWSYTQTVEINHPNSNRVAIQGGALLGGTPMPGNLSVTGYHDSSDGTAQVIYLRSVHATELSFTGGITGFRVYRANCTLRYLLITGSQTVASGGFTSQGTPLQGNGIELYADLGVDGISIWGFGSVGILVNTQTLTMLTSLSLTVCFCGYQGMTVFGGNIEGSYGGWAILHSNSISGLTCFGGWCWFQFLSCKGHGPPNGNAAIQMEQGGFIAVDSGSDFSFNENGVSLAGAATFLAEGCYFMNNGVFGLVLIGTCTAWVDNSTFSGNGSYDIYMSGPSYCEAIGGYVPSTTPAPNTYGQNYGAILVM
jgi:hypothetical protein